MVLINTIEKNLGVEFDHAAHFGATSIMVEGKVVAQISENHLFVEQFASSYFSADHIKALSTVRLQIPKKRGCRDDKGCVSKKVAIGALKDGSDNVTQTATEIVKHIINQSQLTSDNVPSPSTNNSLLKNSTKVSKSNMSKEVSAMLFSVGHGDFYRLTQMSRPEIYEIFEAYRERNNFEYLMHELLQNIHQRRLSQHEFKIREQNFEKIVISLSTISKYRHL
ncbi:hypothetical protein [Vibrio crassostreae]|uniref:hypothetical protein n=1 Tax=Vibrio crassostreae TaxID=246167 RepID=UPI001B312852|nr:hypothetical protein [Vibrio crassostreae]